MYEQKFQGDADVLLSIFVAPLMFHLEISALNFWAHANTAHHPNVFVYT